MAQYRFSATIIGRSAGRSVTAAAAYRAAEAIHDQRTGLTHDYSAKRGVLHAEIMVPENTPDWMTDRAKLWNAVEAAERRKDSQLAREILLSLPHELTDAQRKELVRGYVHEQFTARGLIADVAIHAPGKDTDERNHHAHILLTMRELTGEGFGKKIRVSEPERIATIKREREAWADHQNRMFERLNMPQRVDHRSFLDRGIDRTPTVHMGPYAAALEKSGKGSELGDKNRQIVQDNSRIAENYRLRAEAEAVRKVIPFRSPNPRRPITPTFNMRANPEILSRKEEAWRQRNHERFIAIERREMYELLGLERRQEPEKHRLQADQERRNATFRATVRAELDAIERRLQARGVTRFFRDLLGRTRHDKLSKALHERTLAKVAEREGEERAALEQRHANEKARLLDRYRTYRANLERKIAIETDFRKARFERMADERDKRYERRPIPGPPKLEPTLQPRPPSGARPGRMPASRSFEEQAREWAASDEGKRQLAKDPSPNRGRLEFKKAAPAAEAKPQPEPARKAEFHPRYPKREDPAPQPDPARPAYDPDFSKERGDFWKAASKPERRKDEPKPGLKKDWERDRE